MRMRIRAGRIFAGVAILAASLTTLGLPGLAAFEVGRGETVMVEKGRTIEGDLYSSATTTVVDGDITGDLVVAGGAVTVNGRVDGSILALGDTLTVNGPVGGNIRALVSRVTVNSTVGKNLTIASGSALFSPSSVVGGALIGWFRHLEARGEIAGDVLAGVQSSNLGGKVGGSVKITGERIAVLPDTEVKGEFTYHSPRRAEISTSARLAGGVRREPVREREIVNWRRLWLATRAGWFFGVLLLGALLWLFYPGKLQEVTAPTKTTWTRGFLRGLVGLVAGPLAIGLSFATVIGIPVALALLGLYLLGMLLTLPLAGSLAGRQVLASYRPGAKLHPVLVALAGMAGIFLLRLVPWLGALVGLLFFVLGFGLALGLLAPPARAAGEAVSGRD